MEEDLLDGGSVGAGFGVILGASVAFDGAVEVDVDVHGVGLRVAGGVGDGKGERGTQ